MKLGMRGVKKIWIAVLGLVGMVSAVGAINVVPIETVSAISEEELVEYAINNIMFYEPGSCSGSAGVANYDNLVIGESMNSRLEWVVSAYGELAMDLQREWGTPWEVVFAQMVIESGVGTASSGVAVAVERNGYYNWLGITETGGEYSVGEPYVSSTGSKWAQYPSIENMIKAWAGKYIARNGHYDKAFTHLNPASYDLRGFLNDFILVYAPPSENDTSRYITNVISYINGSIKKIREEKGWPSSEELAIRENIPIGGRNPMSGSGGSSDSGGSGSGSACVKLRSSPNYNDSNYQTKLSNLHDFSQLTGTFENYAMCGDASQTVRGHGCGIMSLYAAFYMFSGQGLNDSTVFNEFLAATRADGYNVCYASAAVDYDSNLNAYTNMTGNMIFDENSYSGSHWDALVSALKEGKKIVILVVVQDGTRFTNGGHYMLLDHYNSEKDMVYLFDPAMYASRASELKADFGSDIEYDDYLNGMYISQRVMDEAVRPREGLALTYDGCYNGGTNTCRSTSNGLVSGGMTYEQAVDFMATYRAEAALKKRGAYGSGYANGTVIGSGWIFDATGCAGGTLNNCVAFSQWFVNNYTAAGPSTSSTAGSQYAKYLIDNAGFEDGGQVPSAYAIFSTGSGTQSGDGCVSDAGVFYYNHTGVILGIDTAKDEVYIGEASCGQGFTDRWPGVHTKKLSEVTNTGNCGYTYAYPGSQLKLGGN